MTRSTTQVGDATRSSIMPETEQEESQEAKATTRPMTQLGGTTRSTAQVGDMTRSLPMIETEQEGSQAAKATTRMTTQVGGTTRSTTQVGDMTRPTTRMRGITKLVNGLINGKEETRPEGRGERKNHRLCYETVGGETLQRNCGRRCWKE